MKRAAAVLIVLAAGAPASSPGQDAMAMRSLLDALIELAPMALSADGFGDPANAEVIGDGIERLANNALMIDAHTSGLGPSYDLVRRTMAEDTRQAARSWREGDLRRARFLVRNLAHDCFACHSRLPAGPTSDLLGDAAAGLDLAGLPARDRMRWLVASRQFGAALEYAERVLADTDVSAAQLDRQGLFEDYLKVALRVDRSPERPLATIERFATRSDLPVYLELQTAAWLEALRALPSLSTTDPLESARALLHEARDKNLYLQDRRGLVEATAASGLLHEYLLDPSPASDQRAEAYYLLGLAESSISRELWVPETEYFLELAIRAAPGTVTARNAYAFLEQYVFASYSGSGGIEIPEDVAARLDRLRALTER